MTVPPVARSGAGRALTRRCDAARALLGFVLALLASPLLRSAEPATAASAPEVVESFDRLWQLSQSGNPGETRVRLRVFVACYFPDWRTLWVVVNGEIHYFDGGPKPLPLHAGEWVDLDGYALPITQAVVWDKTKIIPLPKVAPPPPRPMGELVGSLAGISGLYAEVDGVVDEQADLDNRHVRLNVVTGGISMQVFVGLEPGDPVPQLLGARVRLKGVLSVKRDVASAEPKLEFWCANPKSVTVTGFLATDPRFTAPASAIEDLVGKEGQPVHVIGTVRGQETGHSVTVRDATGQATVATAQLQRFNEGEPVEAIGTVHREGIVTTLRQGLVRRGTMAASEPQVKYLLRLTDQVRSAAPAEIADGVEARIDGVVTWSSPAARYIFMRDAAGGIKVMLPPNAHATPPLVGSGMTVQGKVVPDAFVPAIAANWLRPGENVGVGEPVTVSYEQAMTGGSYGNWVQIQGYVREIEHSATETTLETITPGGEFVAVLPPGDSPDLVGAIVRIRGVCDAIANERRQLTGFRLLVPSSESIQVVEPAPTDPFATPPESIGNLLRYNPTNPLNRRVQVEAVVLLHVPGHVLYVADGSDTLTAFTHASETLQPGDRVAVVGLPGYDGSRLIMREALVRRRGPGTPPAPVELRDPSRLAPNLDGRLVRVTGQVLSHDPISDGIQLQLQSGSFIYSARLEHGTLPSVETGSDVQLTGVYRVEFNEARRARGFALQLRSAADVVVLSQPPWWTVSRILWVSAALLALVVLAAFWGTVLSHKNQLLKAAHEELRHANEELEARVQARTAALTFEVEHRRESEAALARERMLLRTLIDNLPVYLYVKDTFGRFVIDNLPHARMLGAASCEEVVGKTIADFWPAELAQEWLRSDELVITSGEPVVNREESVVLRNERRWHSTTKVPLRDEDGKVTGLIAISQDVTARKEVDADRENLNRQLLETSRRAGMAEVASGVLHNIGNVLNSVNISAGLAADIVGRSKVAKIGVLVDLLAQHRDDLATFFATDKRAQRIPEYLAALGEQLRGEQAELRKELASLHQNIDHIKQVVAMQQSYAKISGVTEKLSIHEIVEDAIRINAEGLARHGVEIVRDLRANPTIVVERHKVLQILVNLISNAKYACDDGPGGSKRVTIAVDERPEGVEIAVTDNGVGIHADNLTRIFSHGFTTRKNGHGFGLHSGALTAKELGGALAATSLGPGCGATFTLTIPLTPAPAVQVA